MNKISFLLGSGFSVPAGYPTTSQLNERLCKIDESEICIHTSREAWFLNGQKDLNASWMGVEERKFVQEFLEYYNNQVLKSGEKFHYETFYDYYISPYLKDSYTKALSDFMNSFKRKHNVKTDFHHILMKFNDTFSQLLTQLLTKKLELVHLCKPYGPKYRGFLNLIEELSKNYSIHIHTLNHDMYFESLSSTDSIQGQLNDGFEELGSNIYALKRNEHTKYMVRLRKFINKYESRFLLYKLHGSIDNYWFGYESQTDLIKIPLDISPHEIFIEVMKNGKLEYAHSPSDVVPEFLSGTTHKVERYQHGTYYPLMIQHFCANLKESRALIVIGYSFHDTRINSYLAENIFQEPSKPVFIVDVNKPSTEYLTNPNTHFITGGVSGIIPEFILEKVKA